VRLHHILTLTRATVYQVSPYTMAVHVHLQGLCTAPLPSCSSPGARCLTQITPPTSCGCPHRRSTATRCHQMSGSCTLQRYRASRCRAVQMATWAMQPSTLSRATVSSNKVYSSSNRQAAHTSRLVSTHLTTSHLPGLPVRMSDQAAPAVLWRCMYRQTGQLYCRTQSWLVGCSTLTTGCCLHR
jgi:hypothetical protein